MALTIPAMPLYPAGKGKGFDDLGYNYRARLFNKPFGNANENRPGGDGNPSTLNANDYDKDYVDVEGTEYYLPIAGTHLVMEWNKAWDMVVFGPDRIRYNGDELPGNLTELLRKH